MVEMLEFLFQVLIVLLAEMAETQGPEIQKDQELKKLFMIIHHKDYYSQKWKG